MSDHSNSVKLGEIIQEFGLEILHPGANYASIPLTTLDVNRPGLPLTGFFEHFDPRRLVVIGLAETRWTRTCGGSALTRCWSIRSQR